MLFISILNDAELVERLTKKVPINPFDSIILLPVPAPRAYTRFGPAASALHELLAR